MCQCECEGFEKKRQELIEGIGSFETVHNRRHARNESVWLLLKYIDDPEIAAAYNKGVGGHA